MYNTWRLEDAINWKVRLFLKIGKIRKYHAIEIDVYKDGKRLKKGAFCMREGFKWTTEAGKKLVSNIKSSYHNIHILYRE